MGVVASHQLRFASGGCAYRARRPDWPRATRNWLLRTAFTLTEVMFAVILLGIGFIMVAAMFPVAIQQNRTATEQTAATQLARAAIGQLQQVAAELADSADKHPMRETQGNVRMNDALWSRIEGSLINASDPRYAWTALYARSPNTGFAQVFVFTLQARNRSEFVPEDTKRVELNDTETFFPANLEPRPVLIRVAQMDPIDRIQLYTATTVSAPALPVDARAAAAENAFVVVASGKQRGRVLRLGRPIDREEGIWELIPGSDLPPGANSIPANAADPPVEAYLIGRGYASTSITLSDEPQFEGPAMDVMMFTGFVRVRQ